MFPPTTCVSERSAIEECELPTTSDDTIGSVVTMKIPLNRADSAAYFKTLFTSSTVVSFFKRNVKSESDPTGTGTLTASPLKIPSSAGIAFAAALVAKSGVFDWSNGLYGGVVIKTAVGKSNIEFFAAIASGVVCNLLVCATVWA